MRIAVILVDRANLGRLLPVIEEIDQHDRLELVSILAGTMLLERFGQPVADYPFRVDAAVHTLVEGNIGVTSAMSQGLAIQGFAQHLGRLRPDLVVLIGDKSEAVAAAQAATHLLIPILHLQGGEHSGTLDDKWRWLLTEMARYHVPATQQACGQLVARGVPTNRILAVGCPSADLAAKVGPIERTNRVLVCYHPDTATTSDPGKEMAEVLKGCACYPLDIVWPNADTGSDHISKVIRQFKRDSSTAETIINLPPLEYLKKLASARACVGNSSSFVRDAGFFGTPVLLVGDRQQGRESSPNVWSQSVPADYIAVKSMVELLSHRTKYVPSDLYGKPGISKEIVSKLREIELC